MRMGWCKECQKKWAKNNYAQNRDRLLKKSSTRRAIAKATAKAVVDGIKRFPCVDCGNTFHPVAMDFDHVNGDKRRDVSKMVNQGFSVATILKEIEKCDLVCSNCHRVRTLVLPGAGRKYGLLGT